MFFQKKDALNKLAELNAEIEKAEKRKEAVLETTILEVEQIKSAAKIHHDTLIELAEKKLEEAEKIRILTAEGYVKLQDRKNSYIDQLKTKNAQINNLIKIIKEGDNTIIRAMRRREEKGKTKKSAIEKKEREFAFRIKMALKVNLPQKDNIDPDDIMFG